jgi:hypothetical protein
LAQAVLGILSVVVYYIGYRRLKHKRYMAERHAIEIKESRLTKLVPTRALNK